VLPLDTPRLVGSTVTLGGLGALVVLGALTAMPAAFDHRHRRRAPLVFRRRGAAGSGRYGSGPDATLRRRKGVRKTA